MKKKILCLLLSVVLTATVGGSFVFAEDIGLPMPGDQALLEEMPQLEELEFEDAVHELEEIRETVTDRFIVKFKDNTNASLEVAAESAYTSAKDAKNQAVSTVLEAKSTMDDRRLKDVLSDIDTSEPALFALDKNASSIQSSEFTVLQEDKRVISLPEKVDPDVFVQEVQNSLGDKIEYIQPDYMLELAANDDETLSLEILPISPGSGSVDMDIEDESGLEPTEQPAAEPTESEEPLPSAEPESTLAPGSLISPEPENPAALPTATPAAEPTEAPERVIVAVIDTGIDVTHPDLAEHVVDGYNFVNDSTQVYDTELGMEQAHGTHVAGIIAQTAPDAKIMPLKCFEKGRAYTSDLIRAIDYAKENGASIVNCSWGSKDNNQALREAMEQSGLFFVCAAGNNRMDVDETPIYPASFGLDNTISVTSLNQDYGFSYYSNYGMSIDIAAIGREVESTFPDGERGVMNGTSMSAGFISGAAAIAKASGETTLKTRIISTGDRLSNLQNKLKDGRALNLEHLISNTQSDEILACTPAADFDVHGYQPTPEESWELFCSLDNVQVDLGFNFSIALKADGTVWTWGDNGNGQLGRSGFYTQKVPGMTNAVQVAAGKDFALVLKSDGTVWGWGNNQYGQLGNGSGSYAQKTPVQAVGLTNIIQIAAGDAFSVALKADGMVYTWGLNTKMQLGADSTVYSRLIPIQVGAISQVEEIASGSEHVLVRKTNGTVWGWGANGSGQLGNNSQVNSELPVQSQGLANVQKLAAGYRESAAIVSGGKLYTWGENLYGQLGDGSNVTKLIPNQITALTNVEEAAINIHTMARTSDGKVYGWGQNKNGQIGDNSTNSSWVPVLVPDAQNFKSLAVSENVSAGIGSDKVYTWGSNRYDQVWNGYPIAGSPEFTWKRYVLPKRIEFPSISVADMSHNFFHTMCVDTTGNLWTWGGNDFGQLGQGNKLANSYPTKVTSLSGVSGVAAGLYHSAAVKTDGTVWTFGLGQQSQLGYSSPASTQPQQIAGLTNVVAVAAGDYHTVALKTDGTVWAWGANDKGQLGNGNTITQVAPIQVAGLSGVKAIRACGANTIALKTDGTVWGWGNNTYGQLGENITAAQSMPLQIQGLANISKVAAGMNFILALDTNHDVYGLGANNLGQLGIGTYVNQSVPVKNPNVSGIQDIAAGIAHAAVIKSNNLVYTWGDNGFGQLGNGTVSRSPIPVLCEGIREWPDYITDIQQVYAGGYTTSGINYNETNWMWGNNIDGQCGDGHLMQMLSPCIYDTPENVTTGGSFETAHQLALNTPYDGYSSLVGETVYYAIDILTSGSYQIDFLGWSYFTVYDDAHNIVPAYEDNEQGQKKYSFEGGHRYFLRTTWGGHHSTYTITISPTDPPVNPSLNTTATVTPTVGQAVWVNTNVSNIPSFTGRTFTLEYDATKLKLSDLMGQTYGNQLGTGTYGSLNFTEVSSGVIKFQVNRALPSQKVFTGFVNQIKFQCIADGVSTLTLNMQQS